MKNLSLQRKATIVSSCTAFFLMVIKFAIGIISGSIAVLSSAIDSLMDLFVSLFNNFAVYLSGKRPDKEFNYGRGKIEAMASFFEGIIITVSGGYIFYQSIRKIAIGEQVEYIGASVLVMIISVIITTALVLYLNYVAKKTENLVVKSDMLHYKTDLFSNTGILIGLAVIHFTGFHIIDAIIGIMISVYIIVEAFELIKIGFLMLMDISLSKNEVKEIIKIIKDNKKVDDYHDLKTRQSGNIKFVEVHLVLNECIRLTEAHNITEEIEIEIKKIDLKCKWDVTVHMDPEDDSNTCS